MITAKKRHPFEYGDLPAKVVADLRERAKAIRRRVMATVEEVFAIGRDLIAARRVLGDNFDSWVVAEVGVPLSSARDWISATEYFSVRSGIPFEHITLAALYDLSRSTTPEPARAEAVARAKAGEHIGRPVAKEIVERHKPAPEPEGYSFGDAEPVPVDPGFYFATQRTGGRRVVVEVRHDGIPHLRGYIPGVAKSFDLTAFSDYSDRLIDSRGKR